MFTKLKIAAIALTSSLAFASTAQAENVSLEKYVTSMVNQAMEVAQQEVKNNVRSAVLTVANNVSFDEAKTYTAKVTITDLESVEVAKEQTE
ncbi:hypothetical protein [Paraglaciecola arctica]|uniref:hypothetical protein n=1 Tax=Paraglaciecola arctica TaxID=1128911 RepID=UPI001C067537|nr:hypothetical protein [Paraglaciecola arctica]MBU3005132.1 hypothetical protein [Paraglaciecola arctica]